MGWAANGLATDVGMDGAWGGRGGDRDAGGAAVVGDGEGTKGGGAGSDGGEGDFGAAVLCMSLG